MLVVILFLLSIVGVNCQQVLTYGLYTDNIHSGFGIINTTDAPVNYPTSQLFATLDVGPTTIAVIGDALVLAGPFQYLENDQIGGFLVFDTETGSWSTLQTPNLFQGKPIYAIAPIENYGDNKFLVVGYFNSTTADPDTPYNNVALCDLYSTNCSPLGGGLPWILYSQNSAVTGIVQLNSSIFVGHLDTHNNHRIMEYNGGVWNELVFLEPVNYYQLNSNSMVKFQNKLYYVFGNSLGTYDSCSGNETMTVAVYNGTCWTDFPVPYEEITYIASNDTAGLLCVASSSIKGFTSSCWNGNIWTEIPMAPVNLISSLTVVSSETVIIQVGIDTFNQAMVLVNVSSGIITMESGTTCPYPNNGICVTASGSIWCECDFSTQAVLHSFNYATGAYLNSANQDQLYSTTATLSDVCTSNEKIFAVGNFVKAGNAFTPAGYALWDGSQWTVPDLPYLGNASLYSQIVCATNESSIWIAYLIYSNTTIVLSTLMEDNTVNYISGVSQLYTGLQWLAVVNQQVIINVGAILLSFQQNQWDLNFMNTLGIEGTLIYSVYNVEDILYLGGNFLLSQKNLTYENIAKKNLTSGEWLYMGTVDGPVYDIISLGDYIYVAGEFKHATDIANVSDVLVADIHGHWVYNLNGGITDRSSIEEIVIGPNSTLYALSNVGKIHCFNKTTWTRLENIYAAQTLSLTQQAPNSASSSVVPPAKPGSNSVVWALIGTMGGFLSIGVIVSIYHHYKKKDKRRGFERLVISQADIENNLQSLVDDPLINKIDENQIEFLNFIGRGGQGLVQRGKYRGQDVAIKSIVVTNDEQIMNFIHEIKILSQVQHPNIVEFIGIVVSKRSKIYLVTELMDADLHAVKRKLNFSQKCAVAKDVAKAMNYLHGELKLLHRDLKPSNVLISKDGTCKLCDFGLARVNPEYSMTLSQNKGTVTYMAPEVLSTGHYNEKADVYSFGILLCELFGDHPFRHVKFEYSIQFEEQFMKREVEPHLPRSVPEDFLTLLQQMVAWDPKVRPSFDDIYPELKQMYLMHKNDNL